MDDNPTLIEKDPGYVATIEQLKEDDEETYYAWRFGDWDRFAGQMFKEFNRRDHVIEPLIPRLSGGYYYISMDWGFSDTHPTSFSAYLNAVTETLSERGEKYNRVIAFKEWCGNQKDPEEWARIIYKDCKEMGIEPKIAITDPSMHYPKSDGSVSISEMMNKEWKRLNDDNNWCALIKGNNTRTGRTGGVAVVHKWLSNPHILPYAVITENCTNLIRTLPMLVRDENNVEDVDTKQEDHPYDAWRYGLMYVRFVRIKPGSYSATTDDKRTISRTPDGMPTINPNKFFSDMRVE